MAFCLAIVMTIQINMQYQHLASMYAMDDDYQYNNNNNAEGEEEEEHHSQDNENNKESLLYSLMATTSSRSMTFVAVYTMALAVALNLYGSTAIVGFTSLRGDYIAPCFSSEHSSMKVGIFGGAIVIFANLLLLCAVVLGEFRVSNGAVVGRDGVIHADIAVSLLLHSSYHSSTGRRLSGRPGTGGLCTLCCGTDSNSARSHVYVSQCTLHYLCSTFVSITLFG